MPDGGGRYVVEVLGFDRQPYKARAFWTGKRRPDRLDMTRNILAAFAVASRDDADLALQELPVEERERLRIIPHPLDPP